MTTPDILRCENKKPHNSHIVTEWNTTLEEFNDFDSFHSFGSMDIYKCVGVKRKNVFKAALKMPHLGVTLLLLTYALVSVAFLMVGGYFG